MTEYLNRQKKKEQRESERKKDRRQEGKREQEVSSAFECNRELSWIIYT